MSALQSHETKAERILKVEKLKPENVFFPSILMMMTDLELLLSTFSLLENRMFL